MNSAELKKVNPGDKFVPKAADHNAFIDAALAQRQTLADQRSGRLLRSSNNGIVPLQNGSGVDQDQFAVLSLDTLLITPTDNLDEFKQRPPVFSGVAVASGNITKPFAILQEPLKSTFVGGAMVAGVTPVQITVSDESHGFADLVATGLVSASSGIARILWKDSGTGLKWAVIYFPAGGGGAAVKWAEVTAVTDVNNYTCSIWNSRGSHEKGDIAAETSKQVRVPDIIDALEVGDAFAVQASIITGEDYEAIQQLGDL